MSKQRGLCELSEIDKILSIVNVNVSGLFIYLNKYSIESSSGKNSDELPACIEKAYVVVTYTLHKFVLLVILT